MGNRIRSKKSMHVVKILHVVRELPYTANIFDSYEPHKILQLMHCYVKETATLIPLIPILF
jgi:hypothetical protein